MSERHQLQIFAVPAFGSRRYLPLSAGSALVGATRPIVR